MPGARVAAGDCIGFEQAFRARRGPASEGRGIFPGARPCIRPGPYGERKARPHIFHAPRRQAGAVVPVRREDLQGLRVRFEEYRLQGYEDSDKRRAYSERTRPRTLA